MSTTGRASRRRKSVPVYQCPSADTWTLSEKRLLLSAIKRYGVEDIAKLRTVVSSRTEKEIAWKIEKIKHSRHLSKKQNWKTPIEKWMNLILELTHYETEDYSRVLSSVMAVIGQGECSENSTAPSTSADDNSEEPNYSRMYRYIEALLSDKQPPKLSQLEAKIFVDLMYSLSEQLQVCQNDAEMVKNLMLYKYALLTERAHPNDKRNSAERTRLALDNEWPADNEYGLPVPAEKRPSKKKRISRQPQGSDPSQTVVIVDPQLASGEETSIGQDKLVQDSSVHMTSNGQSQHNEPPELPPLHTSSSAQVSIDDEPVELKKVFKKPLLYTLNPLCIPVSLLNLNKSSVDKS